MKLRDIGEDRLVAGLTRGLPGVGDDCAIVGGPRDRVWQLLKTDAVVGGIHFEPGEDARKIGWKALCRAISDIAAMGGLPRRALITLAVSRDEELAFVKRLYTGLKQAAKRFDVEIVGGETSRSPGPLFLSIALTGEVERQRCITRAGGQAGDRLYVTGRLGGSIRGKHLTFTPRVAEARWLAGHFAPHAMMDLSDGLAADLPRLARASGCGFEVWEKALPLNKGCTTENALADGEDYELLFAIAPRHAAKLEAAWRKKFSRLPLTCIGVLNQNSKFKIQKSAHGFDHFA